MVSDGYHEDARQIIAFIILEDGCDKDSIIGRLKQYLPAYMIPADIIPVKSFPLSRNNKIDTGALLKTLSIYKEAPQQANSLTATEEIVQRLWQRLFNTEKIGVNDDFFRVGGNSILAVRLMANIKTQLGITFPIDSIFQFSTIRSMGARLDEMRTQTPGKEEELLMKINDSGDRTPLFLAPSVGGNSIEYKKLFEGMSRDQPFFGFLSKGLEGTSAPFETIEEAAEAYVRKIMSLYSTGPVNIGGYSFGGTLAFEMVRLLENAGYTVNTLFILDAFSPGVESGGDLALYDLPFHDWIMFFYKLYFKGHDIDHIRSPLKEEYLSGLTPDEQLQLLYRTVTANGGEYTFQQLKGFTEVYRKNSAMSYNAGSTKIKAKTILFRCDVKHEALVSFGNKERGEVIEREKEVRLTTDGED